MVQNDKRSSAFDVKSVPAGCRATQNQDIVFGVKRLSIADSILYRNK